MASVKVAVRVRPFNQREKDMQAKLIIQMRGNVTGILNCKANVKEDSTNDTYKEFTFDHSYWSFSENDVNNNQYATQDQVFHDLGTEVVECAFQGYNACVFAYGQTGSGKTFTMMGSSSNQGLIPRICKALFDRMTENSKRGTTHKVQVSYLEIYQERVADLLRDRDNLSLKVREHPKKGPYVEGLTTCLVTNYGHIQDCMNKGNANRTTAATNMNDVSSRSHAIFTITFVQAGYCDGVPSETVSKIHLVDLAGSERANATGATGQRLKEGAHINKSLVTLGSVISALAELSATPINGGDTVQISQTKKTFIPYRDSVLTWLLKDSLGGNSKTIMIATLSPADCNYGETLSTLRYANRAKNIINKPTINEDSNVKLIRELRNEISKLKALMFSEQRSDMLAQLHEKEAREKELTEEWTGKWREAQAILREQTSLGLRKSGQGVVLDSDGPHLVAIDDDPLSTGVTLYHLREGQTTIGTEQAPVKQDIQLKGAGMEPQHCTVQFEKGVATLIPCTGAHIMLNNTLIETPVRLTQGCIIFLGKTHVFRFNDPAEAAQLRKGERKYNLSRLSLLSWSTPDLANSTENIINVVQEENTYDTGIYNADHQRIPLTECDGENENDYDDSENEINVVEGDFSKMTVDQRPKESNKNDNSAPRITVNGNMNECSTAEIGKKHEKAIILQRENLERQRQLLGGNINSECEQIQQLRYDFLLQLVNLYHFVMMHAGKLQLSQYQSLITLPQESVLLTNGPHNLQSEEYNKYIDVINSLKGPKTLVDLVDVHRRQLADLQDKLCRKVSALSECRALIEQLDKQLLELIDEQVELELNLSDREKLQLLKISLINRTRDELEIIEKRKQSLSLNLKSVCTSKAENDSFESARCTDAGANTTLSSDTYHTAACTPNELSTNSIHNKDDLLNNTAMSDSGVELKTSPYQERDYNSDDFSTDENYAKVLKVLNSPSTSSNEIRDDLNNAEQRGNTSRARRRKSNGKNDELHRLANQIAQQKRLVMHSLDTACPRSQIDEQISHLLYLQKLHVSSKFGHLLEMSVCSNGSEQCLPVTSVYDASPCSPGMRPVASTSTSVLNTQCTSTNLGNFNNNNSSNGVSTLQALHFHRSMPSINSASDNHTEVISIVGYFLRGTGSHTHYEYEIRIHTVDDCWSIVRRYRRVRDLHLSMKSRYGSKIRAIPFPRKQYFCSTSESVAKSRRNQLEFYLRQLLDVCKSLPECQHLKHDQPITKSDLVSFSMFFQKGIFEVGRYGTS